MAEPARETRDGWTRNFQENAKKVPPSLKFWTPRKHPQDNPQNTRKIPPNTKSARLGYFSGIFSGYFVRILEYRAGGSFFGIFRGNSGSSHLGSL